MASSFKPNIQVFKATDTSMTQYSIVKFGSADDYVDGSTAASDLSIGILQSATPEAAGDLCEVAIAGGGALLRCGGVVTRGDMLAPDSDGEGVATTANAERAIAVAMQSGVEDDVIAVMVLPSIV